MSKRNGVLGSWCQVARAALVWFALLVGPTSAQIDSRPTDGELAAAYCLAVAERGYENMPESLRSALLRDDERPRLRAYLAMRRFFPGVFNNEATSAAFSYAMERGRQDALQCEQRTSESCDCLGRGPDVDIYLRCLTECQARIPPCQRRARCQSPEYLRHVP